MSPRTAAASTVSRAEPREWAADRSKALRPPAGQGRRGRHGPAARSARHAVRCHPAPDPPCQPPALASSPLPMLGRPAWADPWGPTRGTSYRQRARDRRARRRRRVCRWLLRPNQRTARGARSGHVEAVEVHHLVPGRDEVLDETSPARRRWRRTPRSPAAGSGSRRRGRRRWRSTSPRPSLGHGRRRGSPSSPRSSHSVPMSRRLTKKSFVSVPGDR